MPLAAWSCVKISPFLFYYYTATEARGIRLDVAQSSRCAASSATCTACWTSDALWLMKTIRMAPAVASELLLVGTRSLSPTNRPRCRPHHNSVCSLAIGSTPVGASAAAASIRRLIWIRLSPTRPPSPRLVVIHHIEAQQQPFAQQSNVYIQVMRAALIN